MIIPLLNSQVNLLFAGPALPTGAQMTFGVDNSTGKLPATIASEIQTLWIATLLAQQGSETTFTGVLVKNGPNDTGPSGSSSTASSGGSGGAAVPPNTSVLIQKNTAQGGRQGRGRMFMPGAPETSIDRAGILDGAYRTACQTDADDFWDGLVALDLPMILLRSEDSPADPPETVTSLTIAALAATQRRRMRR